MVKILKVIIIYINNLVYDFNYTSYKKYNMPR